MMVCTILYGHLSSKRSEVHTVLNTDDEKIPSFGALAWWYGRASCLSEKRILCKYLHPQLLTQQHPAMLMYGCTDVRMYGCTDVRYPGTACRCVLGDALLGADWGLQSDVVLDGITNSRLFIGPGPERRPGALHRLLVRRDRQLAPRYGLRGQGQDRVQGIPAWA